MGPALTWRPTLRRSGTEVYTSAEIADLEAIDGKGQAPCLVIGNRAMNEAADIMKYFAKQTTDIGLRAADLTSRFELPRTGSGLSQKKPPRRFFRTRLRPTIRHGSCY
jgi:hypothetical protein